MSNKKNAKIICLLALILLSVSTLGINLPETKTFAFQIGHIFQQTIPTFYELYQSAELKRIVRKDSPDTLVKQQICTIQDQEDNKYIETSQSFHSSLADPQHFYAGRKKVASFDDLLKLTGIIDTVRIGDKVIVLFQNGFYTSYLINQKNGNIKPQFVRHIQNDSNNIIESEYGTKVYEKKVGFGDLLYDQQNPNYVVFFGEQQTMLLDQKSMKFQTLSGYDPIGQFYEKAIISKNNVLAAAGSEGVFIYEIDFEKKEMKLKQKFRPFYKDGQEKVFLVVSEIVYDKKSENLILVDTSQGIFWSDIPGVAEQEIQCQPKPVLIENCENLSLMAQNRVPVVIATCPQLVMIRLNDKKYSINEDITFYPQTIVTNQSRILLFGEYAYAVYDVETKLIEQGESVRKIDFVQIINQYIVIVNSFAIYSGQIIPDREKIVCIVDGQNPQAFLGTYQAILQIQGICSQLYSSAQILKMNDRNSLLLPLKQNLEKLDSYENVTMNCFIQYGIEFSVVDSSHISLFWEIVVGVVIIWIFCSGMIIYCVKDIKIQKQYGQLLDQSNVPSASDKHKSEATQFEDNTKDEIMFNNK